MNDIGQRIRTLREAQNMTQEELAHRVGYKSRASINKIELQRDVPLKKLAPIANALGIDPAELAGWTEGDALVDAIEKQNPDQDIKNVGAKDFELLMKIHSLTPNNFALLINMIDTMIANQQ